MPVDTTRLKLTRRAPASISQLALTLLLRFNTAIQNYAKKQVITNVMTWQICFYSIERFLANQKRPPQKYRLCRRGATFVIPSRALAQRLALTHAGQWHGGAVP